MTETKERAASSEQELVEKLAKILHHYVSAAQNIPENEGAGCRECEENIGIDFLPLIHAYVSEVADERDKEWIAECARVGIAANPRTENGTPLIDTGPKEELAAAAERERCIAKCQEILESRKNGHAAGIEAAHLCAMEIESLAPTDALDEALRKARLEEARWWEHTVVSASASWSAARRRRRNDDARLSLWL